MEKTGTWRSGAVRSQKMERIEGNEDDPGPRGAADPGLEAE